MAAVLFAIGLSALIVSRNMPAGTFGEVGPGFFPSILGAALCLISLAIGLASLWQKSGRERVSIAHRDSWSIVGGVIVTAVLFNPVGALPMIGLYVLFLLKLLSKLGWGRCILFAAAAAIGGYLVFDVLLGIPLPGGLLY